MKQITEEYQDSRTKHCVSSENDDAEQDHQDYSTKHAYSGALMINKKNVDDTS